MNIQDFEVMEHTADVGIVAHGHDLKDVFANAAYGMFSLMTNLDEVKEERVQEITLTADDREALLVEWLNELLYLFEVHNVVFKRCEVYELGEHGLQARVFGERFDTSRHEQKLAIKGITYHLLKIEKENGYKAQVVFDI
ncbi:MAG: archease [Chloroflexi bacterium]|nr:archease [Chloroflexota bacterium]